jgi:hypothetical protein
MNRGTQHAKLCAKDENEINDKNREGNTKTYNKRRKTSRNERD